MSLPLYLYQNEQQTGPFSEEQVRQMVQAGAVPLDTPGWREGMADWDQLSHLLQLSAPVLPPPPKMRGSPLGFISFIFGLVSLGLWAVLLIVAGVAHNTGAATPMFNMIVGLFFFGGVLLNFIAMVLGFIGIFRSRANTLAIIGACLNAFVIVALIALICIGLAASRGHFQS